MSQEFRQIANRTESGRADKLFRATISAFCALTRPSRREIAQVEELTLQLYPCVTDDTLRYVAAVLSECEFAPQTLVGRLVRERIETAAPLLHKNKFLNEADLLNIINRCGPSHARVIARRATLSEPVARLVHKVLVAAEPARHAVTEAQPSEPEQIVAEIATAAPSMPVEAPQAPAPQIAIKEQPNMVPATKLPETGAAEITRKALRQIMGEASHQPAEDGQVANQNLVYDTLRLTALTGSTEFFEAALVNALHVAQPQARALLRSEDLLALSCALKSLGLSPEQGFLLVSALAPQRFPHAAAIRLFIRTFEGIEMRHAHEAVQMLRVDAVFTQMKASINGRPASRSLKSSTAA